MTAINDPYSRQSTAIYLVENAGVTAINTKISQLPCNIKGKSTWYGKGAHCSCGTVLVKSTADYSARHVDEIIQILCI